MSVYLHLRQPTVLGGHGCSRNLFWPMIRQHLKGEGRKQKNGSTLHSERDLCLGSQTSERGGRNESSKGLQDLMELGRTNYYVQH